uniref:Uncharacterized protein n=1 Tax=viral metagenome TaxID=1070528 RepID=A0A6C0F9Q3_9ZZZZ
MTFDDMLLDQPPLVRSIAEHKWEAGVEYLMNNRTVEEHVVSETCYGNCCNWKFVVKITTCGDIVYETFKKDKEKDWMVACSHRF